MTVYKSQPLSDAIERAIRDRLKFLHEELRRARLTVMKPTDKITKIRRLEGNIGALEWVLREAENG